MGKNRDRRRRVMRQHSRQSLSEGVEVSLWSCKLEDDPTPWRPYRCPMEFTGLVADSHYRLLIRWGEYASTGPYAAIYVDVDGVAVLFDRCVDSKNY